MILISLTMSGCIEEDTGPRPNIISFSVSISVEGPTELILPMPMFQPLVENISVVEGECEYQRVETPYGDGLWVRLDSFAGIGHKWVEDRQQPSPQMTINLTTMVPLEQEEPPQSAPKYWIPDREFWMNWSSGPLTSLFVSSRMTVDNVQYWYSIQLYAADLETGWNKIFVEGKGQGVNAP
jgi:hypothetical protein